MEFKFIHQLSNKEQKELFKIVNDENNMINLGTGEKWDKTKFEDIINFSKFDFEHNFKKSSFLYLVGLNKNKIVSFGYIHPALIPYKECCLQIAVFVVNKERGKGYGKLLNEELIKMNKQYLKKRLFAFVKLTNKPSNRLYRDYELKGQIILKDIKYNVYDLTMKKK